MEAQKQTIKQRDDIRRRFDNTKEPLENIMKCVLKHYKIESSDVFSFSFHQNRDANIQNIRQVFYLLAYYKYDYTVKQIADYLCIEHPSVVTSLQSAIENIELIAIAENLIKNV